eukprot:2426889-Rhodomonas_salina.3
MGAAQASRSHLLPQARFPPSSSANDDDDNDDDDNDDDDDDGREMTSIMMILRPDDQPKNRAHDATFSKHTICQDSEAHQCADRIFRALHLIPWS